MNRGRKDRQGQDDFASRCGVAVDLRRPVISLQAILRCASCSDMEAAPAYDWKGLRARCEQSLRDNAEWRRSPGHEIPDPLSASRAPATETQIVREEARLGVRLPP